ncbi:lysyl oxidase homolog 2 [Hemicordylus capensis]|uniref:lysyl oxidase homolog 2 n=1 Tax=Hemicordylus capensis TaxID=884348 RepID=UPI0023041EDC|nr:lysyl oxidase homolog 2 [Hemicordylus capensis]XP_053125348.1 lysyl oxidase homolog 2 [Hemicordylus capensis]
MGRILDFCLHHCLVSSFLSVSLSPLTLAQYGHWQHYSGDPGQPQSPPEEYPQIKLRLAGLQRKPNEGRVEVYHSSEWGTVCDDNFSIHNAHVICRQLGYVEAVSWIPGSKFGKGEGRIWLDNVYCSGREKTLAACNSNGWGINDCKHTEDVGVICSDTRIPGFRFDDSELNQVEDMHIQVEDIRIQAVLAAYRRSLPVIEGYVEVKEGGVWKQICDRQWTMKNSRVICGMFGFPSEKKYNIRVYRLAASRRRHTYWPYSMECTGNEAHVSGCKLGHRISTAVGNNVTCERGMPAVVSCIPSRAFAPPTHSGYRRAYRQEQSMVRLKGGAKPGEGRIEVLKNGEWGTVCDSGWNLIAASVACREMGFGTAKEAIPGARLGKGIGPIHLNEVECLGSEKSLTDCKFSTQSRNCNHEADACVKCNIPAMGFQNQIRLSGGRTPYEGRVEILREYNGTLKWGTVCSEKWTLIEAMVACRHLGLGYAENAFQESWYWHGDVNADSVVMSGIKCSGTEMTLTHCKHDAAVSCPRGGGRYAAGASCTETAADLVLNAQEVEHTSYLEDRPMYMLQCALEENCLASSAANTSVSTGTRRLMRFSTQVENNGPIDFRPRSGRHTWIWHECHRHYHSMEVFTHYDLLDLNGTKVAEGHKASFCLEDTECAEGIEKQYECANFGEQGITAGCSDVYRHDIDCQWVDITDVKPGIYLFRVQVNPTQEVAETDYSNNVVKCMCKYEPHRIWMYSCHVADSHSEAEEESFDHFRGLTNNQVPTR